ncbi:hypothetical protein [Polyangium sorediatum]|uniref:Lipoprotein n=1 Tax=Polyangium sorediatum TaxID=889274 RepID=A0ABT6NSJ8_9BACT|nr:hypothetical protein [Polyangium sorediatum]MDI1431266.1 hypothetical protein [Polyangium sorediatum]
MRTLSRTLGLAALALLAGTGLGCAPYGALCEEEMSCRDGNDADIDACIVGYETREDVASIYGCEDRWDGYLLCMEENFRCDGNSWTTRDNCNDERNRYNDCVGD